MNDDNAGLFTVIAICLVGGMAFGTWQGSEAAGLFAAIALFAVWGE